MIEPEVPREVIQQRARQVETRLRNSNAVRQPQPEQAQDEEDPGSRSTRRFLDDVDQDRDRLRSSALRRRVNSILHMPESSDLLGILDDKYCYGCVKPGEYYVFCTDCVTKLYGHDVSLNGNAMEDRRRS